MPGILHCDDWIGGLPNEVRGAIGARSRPTVLAAGQPLYDAGDEAQGVLRVRSGYLRLTGLQEDGRRVLITIYGPGACFAETAVVARRPLNHSVTAMTTASVDLLPARDFWELYDRFPAIPDALCRKFAETIGHQLAERESRATQRLGLRIASVFYDLARRCGTNDANGATGIALPLTQTDLAEFFDVTRQSIQREVTALKKTVGLTKTGGVWRVDDQAALQRY